MHKIIFLLLYLNLGYLALSQPLSTSQIENLAYQKGLAFIPEYLEFISMPCDAHYPEQLEPNLQWLETAFTQRGFQTRRLPTEGIPILLAERLVENAEKTILFYMHVDGQPVDSSKWDQPNPYIPALKMQDESGNWEIIDRNRLLASIDPEWRVFARAAADDKGPISMFLAAWDAAQEVGISPNYSIKVFLDPEEEIGSPNLLAALETYRNDLQADGLIIMDGPMHASNEPTLTFGARGIASLTLTVHGPIGPQHSGHYGNYIPNPAVRLAQLIASMKDEQGRVQIAGFYDGILLDSTIKAQLALVPEDETTLHRRLGIGSVDKVGENLQEAIQYPSLNVRGMGAAWIGKETRTIIPASATAEIDIRLVQESDPSRLIQLIQTHIQDQGYHILQGDPTQEERLSFPKLCTMNSRISYQAFRTPMEGELGTWLREGLTQSFGKVPLSLRTMGGSVPISPMIQALGIPAVILPLVNSDNNQHSPNENLRMGNYLNGIQSLVGVFQTPIR